MHSCLFCYVICWLRFWLWARKEEEFCESQTQHISCEMRSWLMTTAPKYIRPRLFLICLVRWFSLPSDPRLSHIWFWASEHQTRDVITVQSSSSRNVGRSVVVTCLTTPRLSCVTIERCPKELPSTNTISQLIQDTSTFSLLLVAAKWRLILFRSLSENESRSFLHLFSWIRKNNKDLCVYECMWNAHWVIGFGPHPSPV